MNLPAFFKGNEPLTIPSILDQPYLSSLNGFRAISILMVILSHLFFESENIFIRIFSGNFGVLIFFVISGFLITTLLLKEKIKKGRISLKNFYIRRVLRIFPVAMLYLAILAILNVIFGLGIELPSFLSSILYLHNTSVFHAPDWYTGHYWSLSVEEQFYLLFPFLLTRSLRGYVTTVVLIMLAIPVVRLAAAHHYFTFSAFVYFDELIRGLTGILVGSLFSFLLFLGWIRHDLFQSGFKWMISLFLFLAAAVISSNTIQMIPSSVSFTISSFLIAILLIINLAPAGYDWVFRILNNRQVVYVGILSYSIYIWQQMFIHDIPWQNTFPGAGNPVLNLFFLAIVSFLSYHFFEKRFLLLKNKFEVINNKRT